MKALKIIIIAIAIILPSSAFSGELGTLRISLIEGEAYLYSEDLGEWFEASVNMPLAEGDTLWVSEGGRAELHLAGSGYLRLDERTMLDILAVGESPEFSLTEGRLYINANSDRAAPILVRTPTSSARIREAVAMVDISGAGATRMSVLTGGIEAETGGRARWLYAGESMDVDTDRYASVSRNPSADEWERWNRRLDDDLTGSYASTRHLPRELHEHAADFDREGRWRYVREYGYVWVPTISISVGWAPYKHGRWAWRRGSYVWISYEPWGWVPYHYGRWTYVSRIGWCWVPPRRGEVYWGPGFVAWVYQPTYVAWVPLAPGEVYYGYGYYGPGSMNIVNININKTVIKYEYRNVRIRNAVTIVQKDAFLEGKRVAFRLKQNPFLTERPHVGPPRERHTRHKDAPYAGNFRDRRRPPVFAGKHETNVQRRPDKPVGSRVLSVKRDVPKAEIPQRKEMIPPMKRNLNSRPATAEKERGAVVKKGVSGKADLSRREGRPHRPDARAETPPQAGPSSRIITRGKPPKVEVKAAPGDRVREGKKPASGDQRLTGKGRPSKAVANAVPDKTRNGKASAPGGQHPGKRDVETGTARGKGSKTLNGTGGHPAEGKGISERMLPFSGRGAGTSKFR